jgi:hypothetical protein
MMNISQLLTSIKMDLGIYGLALPFEKGDQAIVEAIQLKTLTTFSIFAPYVMRVNMNLKEMNCLQSNYQESIYELPDVFGDRKLIYIRRITPRNKMLGNGYFSPEFDAGYDSYNMLMETQASANLQSISTPSFTFRFQHPNLMFLYNMSTIADELTIEFAMQHIDNLVSSLMLSSTIERFRQHMALSP